MRQLRGAQEELTRRFRHFLCIQHEMTVASDGFGPSVWSVLPNGCMVVEAEGEVILDQVFP